VGSNSPLQFNTIPYPIWRRKLPFGLEHLLRPIATRYLTAEADTNPPATPQVMADYMVRWGLLDGNLPVVQALDQQVQTLESTQPDDIKPPATVEIGDLRLPAQWEPMETVLLAWPVLYPQLWKQHAQMAEAIAPVATVTILVSQPVWEQAIRLHLTRRGKIDLKRVRFLQLPTDDIWVRDYGPVVAHDANGEQVAVKLVFDPLPNYPQQQDNAMAQRWSAHEELPVRHLDLHLEGGNIWSDGQGTIIMSNQVFHSNPGLTETELREKLRAVFDYKQLIITPRLEGEETGHVDLLVKLADAQTVLISHPAGPNEANLRKAIDIFRSTTNAAGQPYRVFELPNPPRYLNWGLFAVWRSYTNALTVNGRVLVPVFGIPTDAEALAVYREAMPDFEIIPIDCSASANGGGAVHCLTKEVAAPRRE